jgi:uncharacterized membrane protein YfcA
MVVRRLCWGSLPGALCALLALKILAVKGLSGGFIVQALGLALVTTSIALVFKMRLHTIGQRLRSTRPERFKHAQPALTVAAGFVIGALVTVTSVGAGALGAAALTYLYPYRLSAQKLVGTDIAHAVPLTLVAGAGHFALGNVETSLLLALLLGSIPGIVLGALVAHRIREGYVRVALAVVLSIVGVKLMFGG